MPTQCNAYQSIASSGSFVMRASLHNRDCFSSARDNLSRPYPSYEDVYLRSNMSNLGSDEFQDLGLNDFLVAQRQVARQKLECLQLTPYQGSLFSRGVQPHWEQQEPYNAVLEASIGYAALCGVVVMDEVVDLNERVDVRMEEVEGDVGTLKEEVVELRNELRELREAHGWLSRQVGELNTLAEDMHRHLCQEYYKNSAHFAQFLLSFLTYVLLSYFVRLHCANLHTPLPFCFLSLRLSDHEDKASNPLG